MKDSTKADLIQRVRDAFIDANHGITLAPLTLQGKSYTLKFGKVRDEGARRMLIGQLMASSVDQIVERIITCLVEMKQSSPGTIPVLPSESRKSSPRSKVKARGQGNRQSLFALQDVISNAGSATPTSKKGQ